MVPSEVFVILSFSHLDVSLLCSSYVLSSFTSMHCMDFCIAPLLFASERRIRSSRDAVPLSDPLSPLVSFRKFASSTHISLTGSCCFQGYPSAAAIVHVCRIFARMTSKDYLLKKDVTYYSHLEGKSPVALSRAGSQGPPATKTISSGRNVLDLFLPTEMAATAAGFGGGKLPVLIHVQ